SARERLFGFINGQSGADNKEAQGFVHLVKDGHASEDASAGNTALIDALRNGGDLLNVFGDFPTETDPRHALAYSPLWDAQPGPSSQGPAAPHLGLALTSSDVPRRSGCRRFGSSVPPGRLVIGLPVVGRPRRLRPRPCRRLFDGWPHSTLSRD